MVDLNKAIVLLVAVRGYQKQADRIRRPIYLLYTIDAARARKVHRIFRRHSSNDIDALRRWFIPPDTINLSIKHD